MSFVEGLEKDRARRRTKAALLMLAAGSAGLLAVLFVRTVDPDEWTGTLEMALLWLYVTAIAALVIGSILLVHRFIWASIGSAE